MSQIDFSTKVTSIDGEEYTLEKYRGELLLIVNTASKCGFTPQFEGLDKLWREFGDQGLRVLGFPCNQFGNQDPGTNDEIASFCRVNYGVTFPMHERIEVNGSGTHPLFRQLKKGAPGILSTKAIKWNFTKFLVDRDGTILERYGPKTEPEQLRDDIAARLHAPSE